MQPLVSIIIPCFNAERWVGEAIQSALDQTWPNKEVIVIDDGSTDKSLEVIQSFGDKIRRETGPNRGGNHARNLGFALSKGEFIQFLDADDLLDHGKIEVQMNQLLNSPLNSVASAAWVRFHDSTTENPFYPEPVWCDAAAIDWLVKSWLGGGMMPMHAWLTPKNIVTAAGGWNESLKINQDGEFFTRVLLKSEGIIFCPGARVYYRSGLQNSVSGTMSRKTSESAYYSLQLSAQHLLNVEDSHRTRAACATLWQRFAYEHYPQSADLAAQAERLVKTLGGSNLQPGGGLFFKMVARSFGWKVARRLQAYRARLVKPMRRTGSARRQTPSLCRTILEVSRTLRK